MLDKYAGFKTQIRSLEKQLKEMDHSKLNPAKVKEVTEAIKNLKDIVKEKEDKRDARKKKKEEASKPAEVQATVVPTEVVKESAPIPTEEVVKEAEVLKFAIDSKVEPIRGTPGSWGVVIREAGVNSDPLCYVKWMDGNLKTAHGEYGAYYPSDLKLKAEVVVEAKDPTDYVPRSEVYNLEADLKSNHEQMIKDLEEEHKTAMDKGEAVWAHRLEQKLNDAKKAYAERFSSEKHAEDENGSGGTNKLKVYDLNPPYDKDPQEKSTGYGGDRPMGAMVAPNGEENSLPLEGSKESENENAFEKAVDLLDKKLMGGSMIQSQYDEAYLKLKKQFFPKEASLKLADLDLNSVEKRWALYVDGKLAIRTLTRSKADRVAKERFPAQLAAGKIEIKREDSVPVEASFEDPKSYENYCDCKHLAGEHSPHGEGACQFDRSKCQCNKFKKHSKTASISKEAINITVAEKLFVVNPMGKTAENEYHYAVSLADGSKLFKITSADEMGQEHLSYVIEKELTKEASDHSKCSDTSGTSHAGPMVENQHGEKSTWYCDKHLPTHIKYNKPEPKKSSLAKLTSNLAFLKKGSLVSIIAVDNAKKQIKFASLDNSLRGWAPMQKFAAMNVPEAKLIDHEGHKDEILGESGNELLVTCPSGSNNVIFREITAPPATPESLNDMESSLKEAGPMWCSEHGCKNKGYWPSVKGSRCDKHKIENEDTKKQSAKECADCHGNFVGAEGDKCPTCGRFAVAASNKVAGKSFTDFDPNHARIVVRAPVWVVTEASNSSYFGNKKWLKDIVRAQAEDSQNEVIVTLKNGDFVKVERNWEQLQQSTQGPLGKASAGCDQCAASMINGVFCHETGCPNAPKKCRHGKMPNVCNVCSDDTSEDMDLESSLNKSAHIRHEDGKWIVYNHDYKKKLGTYDTKEEATKRLRQIEYFKHKGSLQPLSKKEAVQKKADQEISLVDQVQGFKDRMSAVTERLANPPAKTADLETDVDLSNVDPKNVSESILKLIDVLESKVGENVSADPDLHPMLEDLENKVYEIEMAMGIKPNLPEHEALEPEHKDLAKALGEDPTEKESKLEVKADDVNTPPSTLPPAGFRYAWDPKNMAWILVQQTGAPGGGI